ncbi:MAG: acyltransferase family protein [Thermodesulfobacteriota bacterium]
MKYRSEIDGLRAIAVIPVILFHAGFSTFSGGFVGVDVFFVISGYLITTIILSEMEKGTFSIVDFYERRARRILPALFLVMFISLPFAWFWLLPSDMKSFSQSLVAVSSFSSNILFWLTSGYWDTASELKPLLHTWSLAVEEQYYVLFPLFLMLMWNYRKRWILGAFILIAGISLITAQWGAYHNPSAAFYLLPTRGWELAIGAGIAFYFLYRKQTIRTLLSHKLVDEVLGLLGLLMICYGVLIFDETTPFPSIYALIPTIGTGLIILFSSYETIAGRLLSSKPLVVIGLISYSAYLWHQPLLAFARHRAITDPSDLQYATIAFLSFPLAYLSWKYVEKPFRNRNRISKKNIFLFSLIGSVVFISIGLAGHVTNGFYNRYSDSQKILLDSHKYDRKEAYREGVCFLEPGQKYSDFKDECFSPDSVNGEDLIILWGDSHAAALSYGLKKIIHDLIQLTASGCTPIIGYNPAERPHCIDINNYVLRKIEQLKPEFLVLHANWFNPLNKIESGLKEGLLHTILYIRSVSPKTKIIIIGGVPQWKPTLPSLLLKSNIELREIAYVHSQNQKKIRNADKMLALVANENELTFISLLDIYCKDEECLSSVKSGNTYEPFAWDYGHLTKSSSSLVAENILPTLMQAK